MARLSVTFSRRLAALEAARVSVIPCLSGAELDAAVTEYKALLAEVHLMPPDPKWRGLTPTEAAEKYFDLIRRD